MRTPNSTPSRPRRSHLVVSVCIPRPLLLGLRPRCPNNCPAGVLPRCLIRVTGKASARLTRIQHDRCVRRSTSSRPRRSHLVVSVCIPRPLLLGFRPRCPNNCRTQSAQNTQRDAATAGHRSAWEPTRSTLLLRPSAFSASSASSCCVAEMPHQGDRKSVGEIDTDTT